MIRVVLYLFLAVILITLLRVVIGVVGKGLSALFEPERPGREERSAEQPRLAGELKRDPVCGVYVSTAKSVKRTIHGEVVHFCSQECSDKYKA